MDLLGLDSLTSSFGMLVLCRGIASILGPPLAGLVYDMTEEYNASFYLAGAFFVTGGLISFVAYFMDKRRNKKSRQTLALRRHKLCRNSQTTEERKNSQR